MMVFFLTIAKKCCLSRTSRVHVAIVKKKPSFFSIACEQPENTKGFFKIIFDALESELITWVKLFLK